MINWTINTYIYMIHMNILNFNNSRVANKTSWKSNKKTNKNWYFEKGIRLNKSQDKSHYWMMILSPSEESHVGFNLLSGCFTWNWWHSKTAKSVDVVEECNDKSIAVASRYVPGAHNKFMNCKTAALSRDEPWRIGFIGRPDPAKTPRWKGGRERARKSKETRGKEGNRKEEITL